MSILSQLLRKQITFGQAASQAAEWAQKVVAASPIASAAAGELLSTVKQGASNAIMIADTALGEHIMPAADAVEAALEAALASATKGASVPFNPIIDAGIDQMAATVKAAADAWALSVKARLAAGSATSTPAATPKTA